jgi:hypothetical protein
LAKAFGLSRAALDRHRARHLPRTIVQAHAVAEVTRADSLLDQVRAHADRASRLASEAESVLAGTRRGRLKLEAVKAAAVALREVRASVELLGRLAGELAGPGVTIAVTASPEWVSLRGRILAALRPYPDALAAVVQALGGTVTPALPAREDS